MNWSVWLGGLALAVMNPACDDGGGSAAVDAAVGNDANVADGGTNTDVGPTDANVKPDMAQLVERSIDERCPDARAGEYLLVVYPDRVQALRFRVNVGQPDEPTFVFSDFCTFLALKDNGISTANGAVQAVPGPDGYFYVVSDSDGRGRIHKFSNDGEFDRLVGSNVNLDRPSGIWPTFGDEFIVHSGLNNNLYRLAADGSFRGPWTPPQWEGSRIPNVTDMVFIGQEAVVMTFSDAPARLFKFPFSPEFRAQDVGPANAVKAVQADEGTKLLMSAQVRGEGNGYGVALFKPQMDGTFSGRVPPDLERYILDASVIEDGKDLILLPNGFLALDSGLGGSPRISGFNLDGELEGEFILPGEGRPVRMMLARIFDNL